MSETSRCLLDRLGEALSSSPHLFGHKLGYEADAGTVILKGTVTSYYKKQMAQEAIRRVDGVEQIDNQLCVAPCNDAEEEETSAPPALYACRLPHGFPL